LGKTPVIKHLVEKEKEGVITGARGMEGQKGEKESYIQTFLYSRLKRE